MRLQPKYTCRYILANGDPRAFSTYADNRGDAAAAIERLARESLREEFSTSRCEGVERATSGATIQRIADETTRVGRQAVRRRVLLVAVDAGGRTQKILRQITRNDQVLS